VYNINAKNKPENEEKYKKYNTGMTISSIEEKKSDDPNEGFGLIHEGTGMTVE
jgi:hypothetical protein